MAPRRKALWERVAFQPVLWMPKTSQRACVGSQRNTWLSTQRCGHPKQLVTAQSNLWVSTKQLVSHQSLGDHPQLVRHHAQHVSTHNFRVAFHQRFLEAHTLHVTVHTKRVSLHPKHVDAHSKRVATHEDLWATTFRRGCPNNRCGSSRDLVAAHTIHVAAHIIYVGAHNILWTPKTEQLLDAHTICVEVHKPRGHPKSSWAPILGCGYPKNWAPTHIAWQPTMDTQNCKCVESHLAFPVETHTQHMWTRLDTCITLHYGHPLNTRGYP